MFYLYCPLSPNLEHLGATNGAGALGGWLAVLHSNLFWILHFPLGFALHAVCFHKGEYEVGVKEFFLC
jgi:hypothetical protein